MTRGTYAIINCRTAGNLALPKGSLELQPIVQQRLHGVHTGSEAHQTVSGAVLDDNQLLLPTVRLMVRVA